MSNNESIKKTLLLDQETIRILKQYGKELSGSENMSAAVRSMSREFNRIYLDNKMKNLNL